MTSATQEYKQFKCPDEKEFEMAYYGPTGSGDGRNPMGCMRFFKLLDVSKSEVENIESQVSEFNSLMSSKRANGPEVEKRSTLTDRLNELVLTLCNAFKLSE